jgi:hypothetical protein
MANGGLYVDTDAILFASSPSYASSYFTSPEVKDYYTLHALSDRLQKAGLCEMQFNYDDGKVSYNAGFRIEDIDGTPQLFFVEQG